MNKKLRQSHVHSYYDASADYYEKYPNLEGEIKTDVCVVGGGITGISTALYLAEQGYSVMLLEASRIGWAASGRNGGQLGCGYSCGPETFAKFMSKDEVRLIGEMGIQSVGFVKENILRHKINCDFVRGGLRIASDVREMERLKKRADYWMKNFGYEAHYLSADKLPMHIHSPRYCGGVYYPDYGHFHPLNYIIGLAQAASFLGVKIYENSRVRDVSAVYDAKNNFHVVKTNNGMVKSEFVVLACNVDIGLLNKSFGKKILPVGTFMIATEPLGKEVAKGLLPSNAHAADGKFEVDYFRLSRDFRLLWGGLDNYSGLPPKRIDKILSRGMLHTFPQLKGVRVDYAWGGLIDVTRNRAPHFGRQGKTLYYAHGFSGKGLNVGTLAGKLIAEAIHGQNLGFDLFCKIRHANFFGPRWLHMPFIALLAAWMRVRERF
jgi:gamma-glutamylputrescine oxidase